MTLVTPANALAPKLQQWSNIIASASSKAPTAQANHQQLVTQVRKWTAQTFFGPMLKQMRDSPFHSDLMEGGKEGKSFDMLYDQRLADHMSRGVGNKLVNSLVRHIEAKTAYGRQSKPSGSSHAAIG